MDLSESAPLTLKVNKSPSWGDTITTKAKEDLATKTHHHIRIKREQNHSKRLRVVKKLIRIYNHTTTTTTVATNRRERHYNYNSNDDLGEVIGVRALKDDNFPKRRRILVTKRRKLTNTAPTTRKMRKVLIAKRKLLPTITTPVEKPSVTEISEINKQEDFTTENTNDYDVTETKQKVSGDENETDGDENESDGDEEMYEDEEDEYAQDEEENNEHQELNETAENRTVDNEERLEEVEVITVSTDENQEDDNEHNDKTIADNKVEEDQEEDDEVLNTTTVTSEDESQTEEPDDDEVKMEAPPVKPLPDYEPFFPELSESLDAPVLLLKTTIIPSVDYETKTVVQSRMRTYTFFVTRVNGDEKITTSTTEVKPQTKTVTITEPRTIFTTLTLLDWESTNVFPYLPMTDPVDSSTTSITFQENQPKMLEEARYNLATRVMSNGVEVIVAGDKTTLPGEPDVRRIPPSSIYKPITLKPSTLTNHMSLLVPQIESLSASLGSNPFVTKTCLTTFTYLTTYLQNGSTTVSSHEQVVSNIATEEKNIAKIEPTSMAGVTLTQHPNLAVGVFQTTFTYLNTILDGEQPLVVSSKHVVSNTVTAPDDYLALLRPEEKATPVRETNTYYSTLPLQKTLRDGTDSKILSTQETLTQVIITQSIPPRSTSVMTSYIAFDMDNRQTNRHPDYTTTDIVKTYHVTYTYYNTVTENNKPVVKPNIATSTDVVTEKIYINPHQKTSSSFKPSGSTVQLLKGVDIVATKTYVTTYTYYTTLLQNDKKKSTSTVIKSHTREVENIVTETLNATSILPANLANINAEVNAGKDTIVQTVTLNNGQKVEITAISHNEIKPTKVLPIEKTQMPPSPLETTTTNFETSSPSVITGSTIVFFEEDNDPFKVVSKKPTPTLKTKVKATKTAVKNELNSLLSAEIVKNTKLSTTVTKQTVKKTKLEKRPSIQPTITKDQIQFNTSPNIPPPKKKTTDKVPKPGSNIPDLLGLGTINVDTLSALKPVINAMAGLIKTNIRNNKKNETTTTTTSNPPDVIVKERHKEEVAEESQNKPIYIPLQQVEDDTLEIAESQNIATFHIKQWEKLPSDNLKNQIQSPLLNGGIPISPGEIITANSDVIIGKPGRIGPRVPAIPLENPINDEVPIGMRPPPPPPHFSTPNRNTLKLKEPLTSGSLKDERPYSGKENFLRPPTPITIPLHPLGVIRDENRRPPQEKNPLHIIPVPFLNESPPQLNHKEIMLLKNNYSNINVPIQPSALDELIVLPEVIDRSSGQPLLVNLQPSQVAYVNIPHNRSTALIYGGSTEPHVNGQYFDDPSPYTQIDFGQTDGVSKIETIIPDNFQSPDQKRVVGVIKVGSDVINVNPSSSITVGSSNKIQPSKPLNVNSNKDVNIQVPPLSFGMIQQGDEVNGHVINHQNSISFKPPPMNFNILPPNNSKKHNDYSTNEVNSKGHPYNKQNYRIISPPVRGNNGRYPPFVPYRRQPPKPHFHTRLPTSPLEYMTPPPPANSYTTAKVPKIPNQPEVSNSIPISPHVPQYKPQVDEDYDDPLDSYNEDGEYVQESNNRPLYPNEVPVEILKLNKTRQSPTSSFPRHPPIQQSYPPYNIGINKNVVKAQNIPFVRPENQLTNQIIKPEETSIILSHNTTKGNSFKLSVHHNVTTTPYLNTEERLPQTIESTLPKRKPISSSTTAKPRTTTQPSNIFRKPSEKPEKTSTKETRPKVTSMPVDYSLQKEEINRKSHIDTQTEKLFNVYIQTNETTTSPQIIPLPNNPSPLKENTLSSMEVMKPPSLNDVPYPSIDILPPKVDDYREKRPPFNFAIQSSSPRPFSRKPTASDGNYYTDEEILGMNPPAITTYKPQFLFNQTTNKHTPSLQVTTTVKPREPYTRRPLYSRRTTTVTTSTEPYTRKQSTSTTPSKKSQVKDQNIKNPVYRNESETNKFKINEKTTKVSTTEVPSTTKKIESAQNKIKNILSNNNASKAQVLNPSQVQKVYEETHVRTFTTTTIKTTVVKTQNGPPSTSTILVTKTEKYTVLDTVTEIHTLVKPTSIYETVTTTISPSSTLLYPPGVPYGNQPSIAPTKVQEATTTPTITNDKSVDDDLEDFIIRNVELPPAGNGNNTKIEIPTDNDSIFVVMTDKNHGSVVKIPDTKPQDQDKVASNHEANHILLGGVLIASPPNNEQLDVTTEQNLENKCIPECQAARNEQCQRVEGIMRCVCRPGFARMFPDRPCKPTYTYRLKIVLERHGKQRLIYHKSLNNSNSSEYRKLSSIAQDGLDRMVMQSDLRDIYHGIQVENYQPLEYHDGIVTNFYLQLSENTNDDRLKEILKKYLRSNNYSVGGTELYAARDGVENLDANDFDECSNKVFHDCSENAHCFNLPGTYTCSCKEGFSDLSENTVYPGRICSAELIGCERCTYHGTCYSRGDDEILCECFHWYAGEKCQINLKVLLIALLTLGCLLFILLIVCLAMTCSRNKYHQNSSFSTGMSFMPQRVAMPSDNRRITLERRAMIQETSSESGQSDTLPYEAKKPRKISKGTLKKPAPPASNPNNSDSNTLPIQDQKDRSLTVMIPRAKYHPVPSLSPVINTESYENRRSSVVSSNEAKLLSYLDAGPLPNAKPDAKRKYSNAPNETYLPETVVPRKPSAGALVSAGFEVSATVNINNVSNLSTLDTAGGTEADRSENATLIQKISADLISSADTSSQFNTMRNNFIDTGNEDSLTNWLQLSPKIAKTVSEARSCDETTIQPPTKSIRNGYDLNNCNDEADTMAERDVGSTFLLPHTHLYKPDRGSDISGFDSL